ncbi:Cytoplasmic envelopment protein 2 [Cacatuid alphaherpesvirus 2]|uniref:Cytoplasmic envelopment protein 2 n=1 Tax=Cacatuid alphaherpesvirus 2 TaxID=2604840 RepID=A0A5B9R065_9ALPH|nr:Cytoplasmic envelopment protein 2 [Cacatuid alphaherpesvirus 2]QEG54082.1 Cytoplasmic envelopment protein 2 [Cacatuid alphaherpesvirus 2]
MRVSLSNIGPGCAERILNDVNVWTRVRAEPLITIMTAKICRFSRDHDWFSEMSREIAPDAEKALRFFLFLTKPKFLSSEKRHNIHVTAVVNYADAFCLLTYAKVRKSPLGADTFCVHFSKSKLCETPLQDIPDPRREPIPSICLPTDYLQLTSKTIPPIDPECCINIAPGAWWHYPTETIYFFHLREAMVGICPAGWKSMTFPSMLSAFLDSEQKCNACTSDGSLYHADSFGNTEGQYQELFCPCRVPCEHGRHDKKSLRPEGEVGLSKLIFIGKVETVTILQKPERQGCIQSNINRLIRGNDVERMRVPNNCQAWELLKFNKFASRGLLAGCPKLQRAVDSGIRYNFSSGSETE